MLLTMAKSQGFYYKEPGFVTFCFVTLMLLSRLLVLLGVADLVHLVTSLLSFSLPTLSPTFHTHSYLHTLPYTLPLAQVSGPCNTAS